MAHNFLKYIVNSCDFIPGIYRNLIPKVTKDYLLYFNHFHFFYKHHDIYNDIVSELHISREMTYL